MSCIISSPGALFLNNLRNVGPGYEFWNRANVVAAKQAASYLHAVHVSFIHLKKKKKKTYQYKPSLTADKLHSAQQ